MTNFEKWKKELTAEQVVECFFEPEFFCCRNCPAYDYCNDEDKECRESFLEWANKGVDEAQEERKQILKTLEYIVARLEQIYLSI